MVIDARCPGESADGSSSRVAVAEGEPSGQRLGELAAQQGRAPEQLTELQLHHVVPRLARRHGQHARAGASVHAVGEAGIEQKRLSGLRRSADPDFLAVRGGPAVHDVHTVRRPLKAQRGAGELAVLYDEVF